MSDFQQWLLVDLNLSALIKAQRAKMPAVPGNWKPGVFSSDKPWGTLDEATALIAGGKIDEGRELLRRICKYTTEPAPRAVFAKELTRPPEDGKLSFS